MIRLLTVAASIAGGPPWPWSWEDPKVHTLTWGVSSKPNCSSLTPKKYRLKRAACEMTTVDLDALLTRDVVYVQGDDFALELEEDDWGSAYDLTKQVREYKAAKMSAKPYAILVYRGIVLGPQKMWNDPAYAGFWLTDDNGAQHNGTWDFRNASAREYYINDLLSTNNASNCDGAFIDTGDAVATSGVLTVQSRREIFNATARLWGELVVAGNVAAAPGTSFFVTPSLKDHLGADGDDAKRICNDTTLPTTACNPYTEEVIYAVMDSVGANVHQHWAPHRQYNLPSRDFGKNASGCVALVATTIAQGMRGPQMCTCNDCNYSTVFGRSAFNTSFAAYLMGAEEGSYFGAGAHFHENPTWTYAWLALNRPTGPPLGRAQLNPTDPTVFVRHFKHLTATINCTSQAGILDWH